MKKQNIYNCTKILKELIDSNELEIYSSLFCRNLFINWENENVIIRRIVKGYRLGNDNQLGKWIVERNVMKSRGLMEEKLIESVKEIIRLDDKNGAKCIEELIMDSYIEVIEIVESNYKVITL